MTAIKIRKTIAPFTIKYFEKAFGRYENLKNLT
jgi:hypothetical protein